MRLLTFEKKLLTVYGGGCSAHVSRNVEKNTQDTINEAGAGRSGKDTAKTAGPPGRENS